MNSAVTSSLLDLCGYRAQENKNLSLLLISEELFLSITTFCRTTTTLTALLFLKVDKLRARMYPFGKRAVNFEEISSGVLHDDSENLSEELATEVGAEARRGRALLATIRETTFRGRIEGPGFGRPPNPRWSTPRVDRQTGSSPLVQDAPDQISPSSSDSQDLVGKMADRRTSHQAHLKSQASTTDPAPVISSSIHDTEIPIDSAYLDSVVNLAALARMDRVPVPALSDVAQGVTVILEEEDQSAALLLNRRRHENPDRTTPTRLTEGETVVFLYHDCPSLIDLGSHTATANAYTIDLWGLAYSSV
nr:Protein TAR1 [Ipomoea batatas]